MEASGGCWRAAGKGSSGVSEGGVTGEVGREGGSAPTFVPHIDTSSAWNSLKQKPSFFDGRSISSHAFSSTVPTHWPD